jgi:hypothetical protein
MPDQGDEFELVPDEASVNFDKDADAFWNGLSYEDRLKAFHSVCKRIHKGDVVDRGSYRHVLYQVFGFDKDSYVVGIDCGYLKIHNSIMTDEESKLLGEAEELRKQRDEAWLKTGRILNEIDCRIQHGANSNGHLEGIYNLYKSNPK